MKVLVATDGSRASSAALRFAFRLMDLGSASELIVLSVESESPASGVERKTGRPSPAERALERASAQMRRRGRTGRFRLIRARRSEEVHEVISRVADRMGAGMVVVGSEGRDSLDQWTVGGTALRLIYVAHRPVTVVRAPRRPRAGRSTGVRSLGRRVP